MQSLNIYQSLWAMQLRQPGVEERSDEENFRIAAESGFYGMCLDPAAHEIEDCRAKQPLFEKYGLQCLLNAFPKNADELRQLLLLAKEMNSPLVNIIGMAFPLNVAGAIPIVREWLEISDQVGVPILFETHRDCITNDMFYTLELIDAVPEMRLCADLSHYVVNRERSLPIDTHWAHLFDRVIRRSDSFQGRISSHEQIQIQIDFPHHQAWVEQFKAWWKDGIQQWRNRAGNSDTLIFLSELGPPPYAITGADGKELSDRVQEATVIKSWVEEIWQQTEQPH